MIKKIYIKNFRSIIDQEVELSPLTVIVGANNSGKSNLIKALEFFGDIARKGLRYSVINRNGFKEVLPKAFSDEEWKTKSCSIGVDFELLPKTEHKEHSIICNYYLSFVNDKDIDVRIKTEKTTLNDVLWLGSLSLDDIENYSRKSSITIDLKNERKKFYPDPIENDENIDFYLEWLLFDIFGREKFYRDMAFERKKDFFNFLMYYFLQKKAFRPLEEVLSLNVIEKDYDSIFHTILANTNQQLQAAKSILSNVGRYDFLMQELRSEQLPSSDDLLDKHGANLPSQLKRLKKEDKKAFFRIKDTLNMISPLIENVNTIKTKSQKEFFYFNEKYSLRNIESWESSDGSLRVLAILLALECQKEYSTILIEEPEIGLHPWAIDHLFTHIREVIEEKNIQVIVTTHSDKVLENANMEEVLICSRDEQGTQFKMIKKIIKDNPEIKKDMNTIGRMWRKGLLGGVPK